MQDLSALSTVPGLGVPFRNLEGHVLQGYTLTLYPGRSQPWLKAELQNENKSGADHAPLFVLLFSKP